MWRPMLVISLAFGPFPAGSLRADAFDRYDNQVLAKAPGAEGVTEVKQLTPSILLEHENVLANANGALIVVKTNDGRYGKFLAAAAKQKVEGKAAVPILLIERFVTFKEGEERTIQASGQNVHLYPGFHFNFDIGQVVPPSLPADLRLVAEGGKVFAEPLGKAKVYVVTKPLPGTEAKKTDKLEVGAAFSPRYFNGAYKLFDDGRRSGTLNLKVAEANEVTGAYYSDKDGQKYEVTGKIGGQPHAIQFTIKFPRTEQTFQGWLFTGNAKAIAGSSRLQEREAGFYATRAED